MRDQCDAQASLACHSPRIADRIRPPQHKWTRSQTLSLVQQIRTNPTLHDIFFPPPGWRTHDERYKHERRLCLLVLDGTEWMDWMLRNGWANRSEHGRVDGTGRWNGNDSPVRSRLKWLEERYEELRPRMGGALRREDLEAGSSAEACWEDYRHHFGWYFTYASLKARHTVPLGPLPTIPASVPTEPSRRSPSASTSTSGSNTLRSDTSRPPTPPAPTGDPPRNGLPVSKKATPGNLAKFGAALSLSSSSRVRPARGRSSALSGGSKGRSSLVTIEISDDDSDPDYVEIQAPRQQPAQRVPPAKAGTSSSSSSSETSFDTESDTSSSSSASISSSTSPSDLNRPRISPSPTARRCAPSSPDVPVSLFPRLEQRNEYLVRYGARPPTPPVQEISDADSSAESSSEDGDPRPHVSPSNIVLETRPEISFEHVFDVRPASRLAGRMSRRGGKRWDEGLGLSMETSEDEADSGTASQGPRAPAAESGIDEQRIAALGVQETNVPTTSGSGDKRDNAPQDEPMLLEIAFLEAIGGGTAEAPIVIDDDDDDGGEMDMDIDSSESRPPTPPLPDDLFRPPTPPLPGPILNNSRPPTPPLPPVVTLQPPTEAQHDLPSTPAQSGPVDMPAIQALLARLLGSRPTDLKDGSPPRAEDPPVGAEEATTSPAPRPEPVRDPLLKIDWPNANAVPQKRKLSDRIASNFTIDEAERFCTPSLRTGKPLAERMGNALEVDGSPDRQRWSSGGFKELEGRPRKALLERMSVAHGETAAMPSNRPTGVTDKHRTNRIACPASQALVHHPDSLAAINANTLRFTESVVALLLQEISQIGSRCLAGYEVILLEGLMPFDAEVRDLVKQLGASVLEESAANSVVSPLRRRIVVSPSAIATTTPLHEGRVPTSGAQHMALPAFLDFVHHLRKAEIDSTRRAKPPATPVAVERRRLQDRLSSA